MLKDVVYRGSMAVLVAGSIFACDSESIPDADPVRVEMIGGVETVINTAGYRPTIRWTVDAPRLVLGRIDGGGDDVFGSIGGIVVDSTGRVFVGDAQALEIRVFSPEGEHLFSFGREGEGPGEFQDIDAMRLTPDGELLVRDVRQARLSVFGLDGRFLRQLRLERPYPQFQRRPTLWVDTAGRVFDWVRLSSGELDSLGVVVYGDSGRVLHRIVTDVLHEPVIGLRRNGGRFATIPVPHTSFASAVVDRAGRIVSGVGGIYTLDVRMADGTVVRRIRRDIDPQPRPEWLTDTVEARIAQFIKEFGDLQVEDYELPEHLPAFTHIFIDDLDHLWVGRDGDRSRHPATFDIFDPDGWFLGRLELPRLRLMQIGPDFVAGVTANDLGVERAVILPLGRR